MHGEGNGNPLQCSCLENPRDGGAWWAAVYGVTQSRTRPKRLSSSSSARYTDRSPFKTQSSAEGHLGCFHFWTMMRNSTVDVRFHSLGFVRRSGVAGSEGSSVCFSRSCRRPPQQLLRSAFPPAAGARLAAPRPRQHALLPGFWTVAVVLVGMS